VDSYDEINCTQLIRLISERATERGAVCLPTTIPSRACSPDEVRLLKTTKNFPSRLALNLPVNSPLPHNADLRGSRRRARFRPPDVPGLSTCGH
jgi:hypothetical protein